MVEQLAVHDEIPPELLKCSLSHTTRGHCIHYSNAFGTVDEFLLIGRMGLLSVISVLYALRVLRAHGMDDVSLQIIYRSVVIAKLTCASSAWWGFASASDLQ